MLLWGGSHMFQGAALEPAAFALRRSPQNARDTSDLLRRSAGAPAEIELPTGLNLNVAHRHGFPRPPPLRPPVGHPGAWSATEGTEAPHERPQFPWAWSAAEGVRLIHISLLYPEVRTAWLCGAESALHALTEAGDLEWTVVVWVSDVATFVQRHSALIQGMRSRYGARLEVRAAQFEGMIAGTPLHGFYEPAPDENGTVTPPALGVYAAQNKANAFRLALVYRFGGFYFDADMLFRAGARVTALPEGVGWQMGIGKEPLNNAAFRFSEPRDAVLWLLMEDFVRNYDGDKWGWNGPRLVTRVLNLPRSRSGKIKCEHDFDLCCRLRQIQKDFWPINVTSAVHPGYERYFLRDSIPAKLEVGVKQSVVIHTWHSALKEPEAMACKEDIAQYNASFIGVMRRDYCALCQGVVLEPTSEEHCLF